MIHCPQTNRKRHQCHCAACRTYQENLARTDQAIRTAPIGDRQLSSLYDEVCCLKRQLVERDRRIAELESRWRGGIDTETAGYCPD